MDFVKHKVFSLCVMLVVTHPNLSLYFLTALCGGEKYDVVEDMGFSARNRRKLSQGSEPRPNLDSSLLRRLSTESTESTDSQGEERLTSSSSDPELQRSSSLSSEGCKRTLSEKTTKVINPSKPNPLDLDLSSFDFTELRSNSLSSTEI